MARAELAQPPLGPHNFISLCLKIIIIIIFWLLRSMWELSSLTRDGTLVPQPGIEPMSPAAKAWSPNHWMAREFPKAVNSLLHAFQVPDTILSLLNAVTH